MQIGKWLVDPTTSPPSDSIPKICHPERRRWT